MDWRSRLRKLVNREDYLPPWRLAVMRIVDPVEWHMRKNAQGNVRSAGRRVRRHHSVGWTTYAPMEDHAPNLDLHRRILEEASRRRDAALETREALRREHASFF